MNKRLIIIGIVFVVIMVAGYGTFFALRSLNKGIYGSGTIEVTEIVVSSKVTGRIIQLNIDEGSDVVTNEVLCQVERQDYQAQLDSAKAKCELAKKELQRNKEAYATRSISADQLDTAQHNYEAMAAALTLAENQLGYTTITSPIKGSILSKAIEMGELVVPGSPIATMANLDQVKLYLYVGDKVVGKLKLGDKVKVTIDSQPKKPFMGWVSYISDKEEFTPKPIQTQEERTTYVYKIKVIVPNPDHILKPGMPADGEFLCNSQ
ncbi:MAG: efflux RND transporter periplasmic adaptor subunit [Candidatus Saganbacteria bacterium]|nr:efflux RND transporter periplasmic adaptor subunit [Candidatus Saganbacteria bacterium]